jgi:hypothetical protein
MDEGTRAGQKICHRTSKPRAIWNVTSKLADVRCAAHIGLNSDIAAGQLWAKSGHPITSSASERDDQSDTHIF